MKTKYLYTQKISLFPMFFYRFRLFFFLVISICFYDCSNHTTKSNEWAMNKPPQFLDNNKTSDSLNVAYSCEGIEYENWAEEDAKDSCLTVSLINSNKIPSGNIDTVGEQFRRIALSIQKSLVKPQAYRSYNIIFVKKITEPDGSIIKVHSSGMEISNRNLSR